MATSLQSILVAVLFPPEFCPGNIADRRLTMNHHARRCKQIEVGYHPMGDQSSLDDLYFLACGFNRKRRLAYALLQNFVNAPANPGLHTSISRTQNFEIETPCRSPNFALDIRKILLQIRRAGFSPASASFVAVPFFEK